MISLAEFISVQSLVLSFGFLSVGALLSLLFFWNSRFARFFSFFFAFLGCLFGVILFVAPFVGYSVQPIVIGSFPMIGSLSLHPDGLSSLFIGIISLVGLAVSFYSYGYMEEYREKGYNLGSFGFLYNLFLLSMIAVVSAQNALLFLVFWELMALSSYFLVTYESREETAKNAGFIYLIITHVGAVALLLMFFVLAGSAGSFDFASFAGLALSPVMASAVFVLALIAFGSKAGVIPFHIWLPEAHPQAPSNISALMSGVMLKVAIYALILVLFRFLGNEIQLWWGLAILILGVISSVLGVLYAYMQYDLKRLLAFSSIENIGIIFIGIGASVIFYQVGMPALAALALFASLYHIINHALFKGLLFMGSGAVLSATHTKDLDQLGGLAKIIPITGILFFIGAASISAIPPLNGFASEWFMFQSLLAGIGTSKILTLVFGGTVILLSLTSALALATFVKAFGITFLGNPRSKHAEQAKEATKGMLGGMGLLALACLAAGIFPVAMSSLLSPTFSSLKITDLSLLSTMTLGLPSLYILILIILSAVVAYILVSLHRFTTKAPDEERITWDCGMSAGTPRMQYSASGFSMPIKRTFDRWINPLGREDAYGSAFFEAVFYRPIARLFQKVSGWSKIFHTGRLGDYLFYLLVVLMAVLIYAVIV